MQESELHVFKSIRGEEGEVSIEKKKREITQLRSEESGQIA